MSKAIVTGAFSFTGRYIATELLSRGQEVATLTRQPDTANAFQGRIQAHPFSFDDPAQLTKTLEGASVVYNTYWVRFNHGGMTFDQAIRNTQTFLEAAKKAGVQKFIHISVSNPSEDSPLAYYKGKAILEKCVKESGLSYAIIRPTLIFGANDLLLNNIAYFLRRYPVFAIPGNGDYRVQPVSGEDVARLAVQAADEITNKVIDAAGPETYRYDEMVALMKQSIGGKAKLIKLPYSATLACSKVLGLLMHDVVLNGEEIKGLMTSLLVSHAAPTGLDRFSAWLDKSADRLGRQYTSEIKRNYGN